MNTKYIRKNIFYIFLSIRKNIFFPFFHDEKLYISHIYSFPYGNFVEVNKKWWLGLNKIFIDSMSPTVKNSSMNGRKNNMRYK